ncbi:hypothetical protein DPMN_138487 [Dreissena polymorpha]|uniref:Uncharacterized protein n=1 Tax=Dreissena polymorpha TaxID=45954 RepID=A0A9D4G779_DREPO|nr:hypothetical protein DPMN_138487 [Dreissena polymorpha]
MVYQDRELYYRPGHGMVTRIGNLMTDQAWNGYQDRSIVRQTRHGMVTKTGICMTDKGMEWLSGQGIV